MTTATATQPKTIDDLYAYPEDAPIELIDGVISERAAPRPRHGRSQKRIGAITDIYDRNPSDYDPGGWWIFTEVDVRYNQHNCPTHDLAGWKRERLVEIPDGVIEIPPDWVCEILSPTHIKRDTVEKFRLLQQCQVPWYWIIDPDQQMITVYEFQPNQHYGVSTIVQSGETANLEPFTEVEFEVSSIFV